MILLTSFREGAKLDGLMDVWSAAVYQPRGMEFPKADWTDIRDAFGNWTRPRNFAGYPRPLELYSAALTQLYESRMDALDRWIRPYLAPKADAALCCWCPYDKAAQRQLKEHGTFVCHTAVVGELLERRYGKAQVSYDDDRKKMVRFG